MSAELWVKRPCKHGNVVCREWAGPPWRCPGGSEERLDPERVLFEINDESAYPEVTIQDVLDALGET